MPDLASAEAPAIAENCQARAAEMAGALSRALSQPIEVTVGAPRKHDAAVTLPGFDGPGLALSIVVRGEAVVVVLPEASGLLPEWYSHPDAAQRGLLLTLAKELGALLLPEALAPIDFRAARVAHVSRALADGQVGPQANLVPLEIKSAAGKSATLSLIWPASEPAALFEAATAAATGVQGGPTPATQTPGATVLRGVPAPSTAELPGYTRSLLRVKVPVIVTLASKKQPIGRIVELGPGSIIHFDKSCEEMLQLHVNDETIAEGEAVKVGDKFGIRLTGLLLPGESFQPVRP